MKAWLFTAPHEPLQRIERPDPRPGPGQVVIDVKAAGLCHSDVGFMEGALTGYLGQVPIILGHEVAGVISEIGDGVSGFSVGDRVVPMGPANKVVGYDIDGGYAEKCLAHAAGLIPLPREVSFVQGATATDAGQTSYGAVMVTGQLKPRQKVGIIGLGGLGMTGARIAAVNGGEVYAAEPRREVWDKAKSLGVLEVVDDVRQLAPYDLDLIVDFAGFGTTTAGAISVVKPGGTVVQVGLGVVEATISTAELTTKPVALLGSRGGIEGTCAAVLQHMMRDELEIEAKTITFDEIPDGLEQLRKGGVVGRLVAVL
jgi:propanol-preferring alcohol dehydrogenase